MSNPLLETHELPPFASILPEHVQPAVEKLLAENRAAVAALLAEGDYTWDGLVRVLEEKADGLSQAFSPVRHLNGVLNSTELREAHDACLPLLSDYSTEINQNADLFAAYQAIASGDGFDALDRAAKKSVENALRDFRLNGVDLPEEKKKRFAEISRQLSLLSSKFNNNELDATMAWTKLITDENQLAGLPEIAMASARQAAEAKGEEGYLFTLDFPSYLPVMMYADNAALREEMYTAFATRASDQGPNAGEFDNSGVMAEILGLRQELAGIIGFGNYAELSLATKMARTPEEVLGFLRELAAKAKPVAEREFAELTEFAREQFGAETVNAWDVAYFSEKLKQARFEVSDEELKPYFPAPRVIEGMFEVVRRLYDLDIRETSDIETWHEDVTTYNVFKAGDLVARFFLDPYARANKQSGAWMDECRSRRARLDGSLQIPVAYLTCNFTPPLMGKPSLLTHDEVVTLFHEFGHGLHHMLTKVDTADVSGISGVAWDAVELPSQFMENWCWQPEALAFISGHFETGEPLPKALLDRMLAAKNFQSAMGTVRQLEFALFDFRLHVEYDGDAAAIQRTLDEVREEIAVVEAPRFNRFQHAFGHIFGGGYAAGYYSYKWAEVLSADAFSLFSEEGIFNRQTGERFLEAVLEKGGSVDAMEMFIDFRGREPEVEALLRQDGILEPAQAAST